MKNLGHSPFYLHSNSRHIRHALRFHTVITGRRAGSDYRLFFLNIHNEYAIL